MAANAKLEFKANADLPTGVWSQLQGNHFVAGSPTSDRDGGAIFSLNSSGKL